MSDATPRDLRLALAVAHRLNEDDTAAEPAALDLLGALVGCDQVTVITSDHVARKLTTATSTRPERNLLHHKGFATAVAQHPGFTAYRSGALAMGSSVALSDLATRSELRRLPLYADFYRPRGTVDQLLTLVGLRGRQGTAIALNRSRPGFTRRERQLVELLAPHLAQAADRRARAAATPPAPLHRPLALADLTSRERQVATLVAEGATDQAIARSLAIGVRTVHKHLERTYRKLDLPNRSSLTALIHRAPERESPRARQVVR